MKSKKAMELPINVVVTTIIGLVIFGMGIALFGEISTEGQKTTDELSERIRTGISSLECSGEDWICAPSIKTKMGTDGIFEVFIANRGNTNEKFKIEILLDSDPYLESSSGDCGKVRINYLKNHEINIQSGKSVSMPLVVNTNKVLEVCSFTAVINLEKVGDTNFNEKTPLIINIDE